MIPLLGALVNQMPIFMDFFIHFCYNYKINLSGFFVKSYK